MKKNVTTKILKPTIEIKLKRCNYVVTNNEYAMKTWQISLGTFRNENRLHINKKMVQML